MSRMMDIPILVFVVTAVTMWSAAWIGARALKQHQVPEHRIFDVVLAGAVTILGLIIGFSFSMATSRYDERKIYEESEANAIGTEFARADLLPAADAGKVRVLLRSYLGERVLFYQTRDPARLREISQETLRLQKELWSSVVGSAAAQPTVLTALAVSGMNDVLNSEGYTSAAWLNRIPIQAWALMFIVAVGCNIMLGYNTRKLNAILIILPFVVAVCFMLIADIDSPRSGIIRVQPENLLRLVGPLSPG